MCIAEYAVRCTRRCRATFNQSVIIVAVVFMYWGGGEVDKNGMVVGKTAIKWYTMGDGEMW